MPSEVARAWPAKSQLIGQVELFAALLAQSTWTLDLQDRPFWHFIDNQSALFSLIKNYGRDDDSCRIVGLNWILASKFHMAQFMHHVESRSNLADGPS